jgi:hypothetical protein
VQIHLVGSAHTRQLAALLQGWFTKGQQRVHIAAQRSLSPDQLLDANERSGLHAWVLLRTESHARIIFADVDSRRFFVREVPLDNALDEVGREKLAQVLLASFQAFAERRVVDTPLEEVKQALSDPAAPAQPSISTEAPAGAGAARASAPAQPTEQSAQLTEQPLLSGEHSAASDLSWAVSAGYASNYRGPAGMAHGPSAALEGWLNVGSWGFGLASAARYELPHTESGTLVELRVRTSALRFGFLFGAMRERRPSWVLGVGAGWDWLSFRPVQGGEGVVLRSSASALRPMATSWLGRFVQLGSLRLGVAVGADLALEKLHYDVIVGDQAQRTLTPSQVSPHAMLSLGWH